MNYIGIFFTLRFLFYLLFSDFELLFPGLSEITWKMDLLFLGIGPFYASNLRSERIPIKRAFKYISLAPLFFILPMIAVFIYWLLISGGFNEVRGMADTLFALTDFSFSLYSMIFALAISLKVGKDSSTKRGLKILGIVSLLLWYGTLELSTDNILFVLAHTIPFIWASWRFGK